MIFFCEIKSILVAWMKYIYILPKIDFHRISRRLKTIKYFVDSFEFHIGLLFYRNDILILVFRCQYTYRLNLPRYCTTLNITLTGIFQILLQVFSTLCLINRICSKLLYSKFHTQ